MLKKNLCVLLYKNPSDEVRGKTRRYLYEVKPNVFVGTVSPMVIETLWKIISEQNIDATIIYSDKNEQGFTSMSTHDSSVFADFDGILLPTSSKNILKFSNVFAKSDSGKTYTWKSSTTRYDTGNGSCELIYVTELEELD